MKWIYAGLNLKDTLETALEREEFQLYYQPKIDLKTGKIQGVEGLIRWENKEKGIISPNEFIPIAEETGMILPIGEWVLRTACKQYKVWQELGLPPIYIAVNLSARQLYQPNLVEMIEQILEDHELSPDYLELEITESMMMDVQKVLPILWDLKRLGVRISLDDFGTGYSSLYYLKEFPIDFIKIDQSFVRNCTKDEKDATIVKTIIAMAHQLKLEVIAEGVETKEQLIFLQQNLCNKGQGYFFSKPLPPNEFVEKFYEVEQIVRKEGLPQKVSNRKWLEEELENTRQELQDTIRLQQGMIFKYTKRNGKFIHTLSDGELLYRMGLTPEKIIGREVYDFLENKDAEIKLHFYRRAWEGEEYVSYEGNLNGIWYLASLRPIRRGGQVVEVIGSCVDITERKESEERYQKVVEYSPKGIVIHRDGRILYSNPSALKISMEKDLVGKSIYSYLHPEFYQLSKQRTSKAEVGQELPFTEMKLCRKDREVIDIEVGAVAIPYEGNRAILVEFSDVTQRKNIEQALAESKESYQRLVNLSPEPIVVHSKGIIQYINRAGVKVLGFKQPTELLGKSILDIFHLDSHNEVVKRIQHLQAGEENLVEPFEYKMVRQDGTNFYVEGTSIKISYEGEPAIQGIFRDNTARKQAEEALRNSEAKYRLIAENMQDLIRVLDTKGIVKYASPSHEMVLGFPPNLYEGNSFLVQIHPDDVPDIEKQFAHLVSAKTVSCVEFRYKHANGGWVYVEAHATPALDENDIVQSIIVVSRDISQRKKSEELMRKSEKLSVVGQLAAGVAHEIRNPLTSIRGFLQLQKELDKPLYTDLILPEVNRIESIVREFLTLAKPQTPKMKEVDVKVLLEQVLILFESQALLNNVEFIPEVDSDLPSVYCDENQMKQVFMNILQNAVEAMPNGGIIEAHVFRENSDFIMFRFIDQGCGISKERIKKIGEPFYSTKEKGTGLGLMISQKIVQENRGTMIIESTINKGTTVDVILPI
ncbi:EAL domain-containing protein [Neobacillus terrae]|uniref:EAL domain-containing protein n=1 Tax=Neobacillus terrae TaxID=3034837 RepID=UPI001407AC04|nr:EAL domain-containing protein [Neobacillus terrae]NHM34068.1 EAL domain-containing protein [Neobacillus terrae]